MHVCASSAVCSVLLLCGAAWAASRTDSTPAPPYELLKPDSSLPLKLNHQRDFVSFDFGSRIVDHAKSLENVKAIQRATTESYAKGPCDQPAWVVISLAEQMSLEYVGFHTAESFSSYYERVAVLGSRGTTDDWSLLAVVELDPALVYNYFDLREMCAKFKSSTCWVSRIKFVVLSTHRVADIDICTLTAFRAYGPTIMQGLESRLSELANTTETTTDISVRYPGRERTPYNPHPPKCLLSPTKTKNDCKISPGRGWPRVLVPMVGNDDRESYSTFIASQQAAESDPPEKWWGVLESVRDSNLDSNSTTAAEPFETMKSSKDALNYVLAETFDAALNLEKRKPPTVDLSAPPLLALVDRVDELERRIQAMSSLSIARLLLVKELFNGVAVMSEAVQDLITDTQHTMQRTTVHDEIFHRFIDSDIGATVLRRVCQNALKQISWFSTEFSTKKRSLCLYAALMEEESVNTASLQMSMDMSGMVQQWSVRRTMKVRFMQLREKLGYKAWDNDSEKRQMLETHEQCLEGARLYLQLLRSELGIFGTILQQLSWIHPKTSRATTDDPLGVYFLIFLFESVLMFPWIAIAVASFAVLLIDSTIRIRDTETILIQCLGPPPQVSSYSDGEPAQSSGEGIFDMPGIIDRQPRSQSLNSRRGLRRVLEQSLPFSKILYRRPKAERGRRKWDEDCLSESDKAYSSPAKNRSASSPPSERMKSCGLLDGTGPGDLWQ